MTQPSLLDLLSRDHDPDTSRAAAESLDPLTLEQALILQSFPPDYPVQGTKGQKFRQVGDAVPPLLARHVLAEVIGAEMEMAA